MTKTISEHDTRRDEEPRRFDPLVTPYEIEGEIFPSGGSTEAQYMHILRYAILAPSSHNTQPWKFQLLENGISVFADYTRRLPVADPNHRELLMGVGAAIMNIRVAAIHFGFETRVDYNYSGDSELPLAFVTLARASARTAADNQLDKLFYAIAKRHTNRHPFLMARVSDSVLTRLCEYDDDSSTSIFLSTDARRNTEVAHLVAKAERVLQADPQFRKELGEWLRPNNTMKPDGMTGASFGIGDAVSTLVPWAVKAIDMSGVQARYDERLCIEAPALCVLYGEDTVQTWLAVGETLERVLLGLTRDGLQFSFFNMPIELPEARLELRQILGIQSWPQLLLRIGYSLEKPAFSPRRSVEECIVSSSL